MSDKIEDKLHERSEFYNNLQRLRAFLKVSIEEKFIDLDYDALNMAAISFAVFTNRAEGMAAAGVEPYIKDYESMFSEYGGIIEKRYMDTYSSIIKLLCDSMRLYTSDNGISINTHDVSIFYLSKFEPESWCREHVVEYEKHGLRMVDFIYSKMDEMKATYEELELLWIKLQKIYHGYYISTSISMRQIEHMYGRKLKRYISQHQELEGNFNYLYQRLDKMMEGIESQIYEHDSKIEKYVENIDEIFAAVGKVSSDLSEVKEIVLGLDDDF